MLLGDDPADIGLGYQCLQDLAVFDVLLFPLYWAICLASAAEFWFRSGAKVPTRAIYLALTLLPPATNMAMVNASKADKF